MNFSGEYYKFALVNNRITPVLKNEAIKILIMIAPVVNDFVSNPILLIKLIFKVRMMIFQTEISIVTELPRTNC